MLVFAFVSLAWGDKSKQKVLLRSVSKSILSKVSSRSFNVSGLTFKSLIYFKFIFVCMVACSVTQLCPSLCNPVAYSPPESSVDGIFQASILEWVAISYSSESSWPRDWTCVSFVSCIGRQILYLCTTWEWCDKVIHFDSFPNSCPIFPAASIEETFFPIVYSWLLCCRLFDHVCVGFFLGSLFWFVLLCICFCTSTTLFYYCIFIV